MSSAVGPKRNRCRHKFCRNGYDYAVCGDNPFAPGAECLPCFYAGQLIHNEQTPEMIEEIDHLIEAFIPHLDKGGWNWQDVKNSYERMKLVPREMIN